MKNKNIDETGESEVLTQDVHTYRNQEGDYTTLSVFNVEDIKIEKPTIQKTKHSDGTISTCEVQQITVNSIDGVRTRIVLFGKDL